jgi:surface polysaccharide O-acyltransferase-like enzyme
MKENNNKNKIKAWSIAVVICRFFMMPLPFIGLLFTLHFEYEWYDRNKKWYLLYQAPMILLLAILFAVVFKNGI